MNFLEERIVKDGIVKSGNVLKVDSFLADYLNGDVYFRTHYPEHNLVRCRTQFALVADMLSKWEEMNKIVTQVASSPC